MVAESKASLGQGPGAARLGWLRMGQAQWLPRLLAFLILVSAVGALYFWLANGIDDIHDSTQALTTKAEVLERENAELMTQVAAWNRPDAVAARAPELGLGPGARPVFAHVASPKSQAQAGQRPNDVASWWQQIVQDLARRWSGVTRTAEAPVGR